MAEFWETAFTKMQMAWGLEPTVSASLARPYFARAGAKDVLIPGIGYDRNAKPFLERGTSVTGIAISETAIAHARSRLGLEIPIVHGSVTDMPFDRRQYDGIFCFGLVHSSLAVQPGGAHSRGAERSCRSRRCGRSASRQVRGDGDDLPPLVPRSLRRTEVDADGHVEGSCPIAAPIELSSHESTVAARAARETVEFCGETAKPLGSLLGASVCRPSPLVGHERKMAQRSALRHAIGRGNLLNSLWKCC